MVSILKSYLKRLANLSSRNKSILLLKDSQEQFIDLNAFDFINGKPAFDLVNQLIAEKKSIYLVDEIDPRYEKVNEVSKRLRRIARTEKFIEQERGSADLYVGYPFVKGKLLDGTVVRCPLLFFPVTINLEKQKWQLIKRENEPISLNRSFLLAYSYFNNAKITDEFLEKTFEDFSKDSLQFRTELYEFLKESPLIINFNQDLFNDSLISFDKMLKADLENIEKNGELKLFSQAVLGIFPQAGSFLVPDYELLIQNSENESEPNESNLADDSRKAELKEIFESKAKIIDFANVKEEKIMAPFEMDASQELAIRQINAGSSMVIQGPPGTGKSQLICNLIADFAAAGKKVLVVCQKRAALDVVHNRLKAIGFDNFTGLVHDFKNDRKLLFSQLADQISLVEEYKKKNMSLDALWLEQDFNQTSRQIEKLADELASFKIALFDTNEYGNSIKNLYLTSNPKEAAIDLGNDYKFFNSQSKSEFIQQLEVYQKYSNLLTKLNDFWKNRIRFEGLNQNDLSSAKKILQYIKLEMPNLNQFIYENYNRSLNWEGLKQLKNELSTVQNILQTIDNEGIWKTIQFFISQKKPLKILESIENIEAQIEEIYNETGLENTLQQDNLFSFLTIVHEAVFAQKNILSSTTFNLFSKNKALLKSVLSANGLEYSKVGLGILEQRIENKIKIINLFDANPVLFDKSLIENLPKANFNLYQPHFIQLKNTKKVFENAENIKALNLSSVFDLPFIQAIELLENTIKITKEYFEKAENFEKYFTLNQLNILCLKPEISEEIEDELNSNFENFYEVDQLKSRLSNTELKIIELLSTTKIKEDQVSLFENSLNLAWIAHIEEKYPILRAVSSLKMEQLEADLQQKIIHKQSLSQQILLLKAREHTYKGLAYNRLQNQTTYRELLHQTTKKKKIWSVRQLISNFSDEIFDLIPCWLASPETVSAVFPMESFFDLVIFDEASQCYAEAGLPAIYRGKQVVITGDSKQLQPSDLYAVRFDDETDDTPELEVNSLLDLAIQYLPQTQLTGHYRSQSIDLIEFSNQHFYKNKLQILPHFNHINSGETNIKFLKVNGIFHENKNEIEANEVIELVKKLKTEYPTKSIGIVTFNHAQQNLIQEKIEIIAFKEQNLTENLFVKNTENVQGDERDIIIFSVGYGPDPKGKIKIQFGSLNLAGGENRLNVAITRARFQIYMVASIVANQLNVDDTLNEGPKLLKKYIAYAQQVAEGQYIKKDVLNEVVESDNFLKNRLKIAAKNLSEELPFADLVLKNNNQFEELLLTDDNLFYQSLSAKEAHGYWPIGFAKKGWKFTKYYSREYWRNR